MEKKGDNQLIAPNLKDYFSNGERFRDLSKTHIY